MAAPINNRGGRKSDKLWRDALMLASRREDVDGRSQLAKMAEKCVEQAVGGDLVAMKEIGDRLDGKPMQSTNLTIRDARQLTDAELIAVLQEGSGEGITQSPADSILAH